MLKESLYPILEYDSNIQAKLQPSSIIKKTPLSKACVITFFKEIINKKLEAGVLEQIGVSTSETVDIPIYEIKYNDCPLGLVGGFVGAAGSAALLEELIASGFNKFIVCGGAGVLQKDVQVGHLVIPYSAVRDEGVSYHYIEPSREIECNPDAVMAIERVLYQEKIPYIKAKTWTTDAIFRETEAKIAKRAAEGCVTVEMEAAAFFAVSKFRNVLLGQILYGGDDLSGVKWDKRSWISRESIRANLVDLCLRIAAEL
jgi:uridine phosphorylase